MLSLSTMTAFFSGVTAASVALAEAGVEMFGLVIGSCAVRARSEHGKSRPNPLYDYLRRPIALASPKSIVLYDPTYEEASLPSASLVSLAYIPALGSVTSLNLQGEIPPIELKTVIKSLCLYFRNRAHVEVVMCVILDSRQSSRIFCSGTSGCQQGVV